MTPRMPPSSPTIPLSASASAPIVPPQCIPVPQTRKRCVRPGCTTLINPAYSFKGVCERCVTCRYIQPLGREDMAASTSSLNAIAAGGMLRSPLGTSNPFTSVPLSPLARNSPGSVSAHHLGGQLSPVPASVHSQENAKKKRSAKEAGLYSNVDLTALSRSLEQHDIPSSVASHMEIEKQKAMRENPYSRVGMMTPQGVPPAGALPSPTSTTMPPPRTTYTYLQMQPQPQSRTVLSYPTPSEHRIRLCARQGCASIITPRMLAQGAFCTRCQAVVREQRRMYQEEVIREESQRQGMNPEERGSRRKRRRVEEVRVRERPETQSPHQQKTRTPSMSHTNASPSNLTCHGPPMPVAVPRNAARPRQSVPSASSDAMVALRNAVSVPSREGVPLPPATPIPSTQQESFSPIPVATRVSIPLRPTVPLAAVRMALASLPKLSSALEMRGQENVNLRQKEQERVQHEDLGGVQQKENKPPVQNPVRTNTEVQKEEKAEQVIPPLSLPSAKATLDEPVEDEEEVDLELTYPDLEEIEEVPSPSQSQVAQAGIPTPPASADLCSDANQKLTVIPPRSRQHEKESLGTDMSLPVQAHGVQTPPYLPLPQHVLHRLQPTPVNEGLYATKPLQAPHHLQRAGPVKVPRIANTSQVPRYTSFIHELPESVSEQGTVDNIIEKKSCSSSGCSSTIPPESMSSRCMLCVRKAWILRRSGASSEAGNRSAGFVSESRAGESKRTPHGVLVEIGRPRRAKKSVTWADLPGRQSGEEEGETGSSESEADKDEDGQQSATEEPQPEKLKLCIPKAAVAALIEKREAAASLNAGELRTLVDLAQLDKTEPQENLLFPSSAPNMGATSAEAVNLEELASSNTTGCSSNTTTVMDISKDIVLLSADEAELGGTSNKLSTAEVDGGKDMVESFDQVGVDDSDASPAIDVCTSEGFEVETTTATSLKTPLTADIHGPTDTGQSLSAEDENISGWDSDLTSLSESENEGKLEMDPSSSECPPQSTSLKIKIPGRSSINTGICTIRNCTQVLPFGYPWKCCVLCRARTRKYQRKRQNLQGRHSKLDNELELVQAGISVADLYPASETPMHPFEPETDCAVVPGARLCSLRSCSHILPLVSEYRWKMCALCRKRTTERRRRKELKSRIENGLPLDTMNVSDSEEEILNLAPLPGRCINQDCGMFVGDRASSSECRQCVTRRLGLPGNNGKKRGQARGARTSNFSTPIASALTARLPSEKRTNSMHNFKPPSPPPYPAYKQLSALLSDFKNRLDGFLEAQSWYYHCAGPKKINRFSGSIFGFDGEFSTVAMDYDVVGRREDVEKGVLKAKKDIERFGIFSFNPKRWVSIINIGIIMHFICVHQTTIHLPTPVTTEKPHVPTLAKSMQGKLEIAVLEDHSHPLLPGQRTVIRFRMVG